MKSIKNWLLILGSILFLSIYIETKIFASNKKSDVTVRLLPNPNLDTEDEEFIIQSNNQSNMGAEHFQLPQTSGQQNPNWMVIGISLIILSIGFIIYIKFKENRYYEKN
ncbi:hypothetical protein BTT_59300 (plasmid) [Bacillus thuringiensis serovar morrisoni str. 4AA1]|uniref:LPXTG cell wall anchor domain-containing protein n=1 Tax=Bacillus TaxID=1386 RepID=UPI000A3B12DA|nr:MULTISPECIES: LPXTG cell wall anchor domain-containing protein [Bacillus]MED3102198.1 LPXTG cell wall anchor domain-containing protein [Bacillus thuringiensis]MRA99100.1 LPXTG cell wall anchor domain-containing protein [Bacillus thuringiensis]OTY31041.1 hypothetical protein BK736_26415 [Bacillus thuringiensis serovar poloniensis]RNG26145.1 LPXTG cell wall anchor domain-containing protein [Bacillus thuringiensis]RUR59847.1 LPXTG cell wall anchor domain-containing protein [Bacillus sp. VKPM B